MLLEHMYIQLQKLKFKCFLTLKKQRKMEKRTYIGKLKWIMIISKDKKILLILKYM